MPKHWLLFLFRLQFFKIEITSGCKIKELQKTWSNFIALHKLVCIMRNAWPCYECCRPSHIGLATCRPGGGNR